MEGDSHIEKSKNVYIHTEAAKSTKISILEYINSHGRSHIYYKFEISVSHCLLVYSMGLHFTLFTLHRD